MKPTPHSTSRPAQRLAARAGDWVRDTGMSDRFKQHLRTEVKKRNRRRLGALGAAAAIAVALWVQFPPMANRPGDLKRGPEPLVMSPSTMLLEDGTQVQLNHGATVSAFFVDGLRRVVLRGGEAHFDVAKDPSRPFVVEAAGFSVRAIGTAFSVRLGSEDVAVVVTEGTVQVDSTAPVEPTAAPLSSLAVLTAGKQVVIRHDAHHDVQASDLSGGDLERTLAWRVPKVELGGTPLRDAIRVFEEHARVKIELADPTIGDLEVSGILRADKVDPLLKVLELEFHVKAQRHGSQIVLRR